VGSASCWVRWEICLFILVELMMAVVGFQLWVLGWRFSVFSCGLSVVGSASCWMRWEICLFLLVELMMAVVGCRLWVVSSRLWVFGCGFCFVLGAVGNLFVFTR
jgi:hypothetical protein